MPPHTRWDGNDFFKKEKQEKKIRLALRIRRFVNSRFNQLHMDSVPAWLNPCIPEGHAWGTWAASEFQSAEVPEPMGDHDEYWRGDREGGTFVHCCGNVKWCSPCGRQFGAVASTVESACSAGEAGSIPGSGRSPGNRNGNPLQYPCLENSMVRGAWRATAHGVAKGRTQLNN